MPRQSGAWNLTSSKTVSPDLEVLASAANADITADVVLDASTVTPDTDGVLRLVAGTPLSKNANNQYEKFTGAGGQVCRGILCETIEFPDNSAAADAPSAMWYHGQVFRSDRIVGWATQSAAIKAALPTCVFV